MLFCTNCGVRHDENVCFCTNCGERIDTATHSQLQTPDAVLQTPDAAQHTMDAAQHTMDAVLQTPDAVLQTPDAVLQTPDAAQETPLQPGYNLLTGLSNFPDHDRTEVPQGQQNARKSRIFGILSISASLTVIGGAVLGALAIVQARLAGKKKHPAPGGFAAGFIGLCISIFVAVCLIFSVANPEAFAGLLKVDIRETPFVNSTHPITPPTIPPPPTLTTGGIGGGVSPNTGLLPVPPESPASRTIMLFMIGSDLESAMGLASLDILEVQESGVDLSSNNVLIFTGGASKWHISQIPKKKNMIFQVTDDGLLPVWDSEARNLGNPEALADFLTFCYTNYKAQAYDLILWNHGAGPMIGYGYDELSRDILTLAELSEAMERSPFGEDNKLSIIGFDACLMNSIEIAFAFCDFADYLVASQETIPGWGWDYSYLGKIRPEMSAEEVAIIIIDTYFDFNELMFDYRPSYLTDITLSCLDMSFVADVELGLNALYSNTGEELEVQTFRSFAYTRSMTKEIGLFTTGEHLDLVDLVHLNDLMSRSYPLETLGLSEALSNLIVYNRTNTENANGVSLYYPYADRRLMKDLASLYRTFGFADDYTGFMQLFVSIVLSDPLASWDLSETDIIQDSATSFYVQLTPEQAENYASARFLVLRKEESGGKMDAYYPAFFGSDVSLSDDGKLYANYYGKSQQLFDKDTGEVNSITLIERERTDKYIRYHIPAVLCASISSGDNVYLSGVLQLQTAVYGGNATILSFIPEENDRSPVVARPAVDIYSFERIEFRSYGRLPTYNPDGSMQPYDSWDRTGTMMGMEVILDNETRDSIQFSLADINLDSRGSEYYLIFEITDIQGNVTTSNLILVN